MKPRTLLILLAVVLGLGAFIWFYERDLPSSEERAERGRRVLDLDKEEVTAVTLEGARGTIRLERVEAPAPPAVAAEKEEGEGGEPEAPSAEWRMVQPVQARADFFAIDRLLQAIGDLEKTRTLEDVSLADVGLDKPRATVRLATEEGEKVLKIGAAVPTGGAVIAGLGGEDKTAYVVSDTILTDLERDPTSWRDRRLFRAERDAVQRITLTGGPTGPVVLARRPDGFWLEKPLADRADRDQIEGLFSDLTGLTAEGFLSDRPLGELGLAPPAQVVEVAVKGEPPVRIELGGLAAAGEGQAPGELTYARVGGALVEVRTRLAESIQRPPADWRSPQLSGYEVHDVTTFTVNDGKATLSLSRAGTDWKRGEATISYLPVSDLLYEVISARADRILPLQDGQALGKPLFTFELRTQGRGTETLTFYPPTAEGVPARTSARQALLLLPKNKLAEVQKQVQAVRTAKPVTPAGG